MLSSLMLSLLFAAVPLVIPLAIIAGHRGNNGPLVATASGAAAALLIFWLFGGVRVFLGGGGGYLAILSIVVVFLAGLLLSLAATTLALTSAAQAKRWPWVALLSAAIYLSAASVVISLSQSHPCLFMPRTAPALYYYSCSPLDPLWSLLLIMGYFAGPAAALAYGLGAARFLGNSASPTFFWSPGGRTLPEGLSVSPLGADPEFDDDLEESREPL